MTGNLEKQVQNSVQGSKASLSFLASLSPSFFVTSKKLQANFPFNINERKAIKIAEYFQKQDLEHDLFMRVRCEAFVKFMLAYFDDKADNFKVWDLDLGPLEYWDLYQSKEDITPEKIFANASNQSVHLVRTSEHDFFIKQGHHVEHQKLDPQFIQSISNYINSSNRVTLKEWVMLRALLASHFEIQPKYGYFVENNESWKSMATIAFVFCVLSVPAEIVVMLCDLIVNQSLYNSNLLFAPIVLAIALVLGIFFQFLCEKSKFNPQLELEYNKKLSDFLDDFKDIPIEPVCFNAV